MNDDYPYAAADVVDSNMGELPAKGQGRLTTDVALGQVRPKPAPGPNTRGISADDKAFSADLKTDEQSLGGSGSAEAAGSSKQESPSDNPGSEKSWERVSQDSGPQNSNDPIDIIQFNTTIRPSMIAGSASPEPSSDNPRSQSPDDASPGEDEEAPTESPEGATAEQDLDADEPYEKSSADTSPGDGSEDGPLVHPAAEIDAEPASANRETVHVDTQGSGSGSGSEDSTRTLHPENPRPKEGITGQPLRHPDTPLPIIEEQHQEAQDVETAIEQLPAPESLPTGPTGDEGTIETADSGDVQEATPGDCADDGNNPKKPVVPESSEHFSFEDVTVAEAGAEGRASARNPGAENDSEHEPTEAVASETRSQETTTEQPAPMEDTAKDNVDYPRPMAAADFAGPVPDKQHAEEFLPPEPRTEAPADEHVPIEELESVDPSAVPMPPSSDDSDGAAPGDEEASGDNGGKTATDTHPFEHEVDMALKAGFNTDFRIGAEGPRNQKHAPSEDDPETPRAMTQVHKEPPPDSNETCSRFTDGPPGEPATSTNPVDNEASAREEVHENDEEARAESRERSVAGFLCCVRFRR